MRKVNLEKLPKNKKGYDWNKCVGSKVQFVYDDVEGEIEIISYNKKGSRLEIIYNDVVYNVKSTRLLEANLGSIVMKYTSEYKLKVGDVINNGRLEIIDRKRIVGKNGTKYKKYKIKCNNCSFNGNMKYHKDGKQYDEHWIQESSLLSGVGCPCCCNSPNIVVTDINSIYSNCENYKVYGIKYDDAIRYSCMSGETINVTCPICGRDKNIRIADIFSYKSICCSCGDGKSYPEKFMCSFLNQLNIDYETEYTPIWSNGRRYDFHIMCNVSIIETHGAQHPGTKHHDNKGFTNKGTDSKSVKDVFENDVYKEKLAKDNGIKNYIVIDCSKSDMEFIKNEILNSQLAELYNLSDIDWNKCEEYALKNIVKEVCDYWNHKKEWETTTDLMKAFKLSRTAIIDYLKKGTSLEWCNYDPNDWKGHKRVGIYKNGKLLKVFESVKELHNKSEELYGVKLDFRNISAVCNGKRKTHKGYTFKYAE